MLHAATVLQNLPTRRVAAHVQCFNLCNLWRSHWLAWLSPPFPPSSPPSLFCVGNLWAQHVQKAEQSFSSPPDLWLQNFSSLFACNTLCSTEFGQRQRACPFNVAVKPEEKLFALFAQLKKNNSRDNKSKIFVLKKPKLLHQLRQDSELWGRGTANQPVRM